LIVGDSSLRKPKGGPIADTLKNHYVTGRGYMLCTEAVYANLLGGRSHQIRTARGLEPMVNIRDNLSVAELAFVMAAEALAAERIEQEIRLGNDECIDATAKSATAIRDAIDTDRKNRQARLPGS
jgi:hypothetical protein